MVDWVDAGIFRQGFPHPTFILGGGVKVVLTNAGMRVMSDEEQRHLLISLVTAMIDVKSKPSEERTLLLELAQERHVERKHADHFLGCREKECLRVASILLVPLTRQVSFPVPDLKQYASHFKLHIRSQLHGVVNASIEEQFILKT